MINYIKSIDIIYHFVVSLSNREKDIEIFLESSRSKFIGYTLGRYDFVILFLLV